MIVKNTKFEGFYYINGRPVLASNWNISKNHFSEDDQQEFETYCKTNNINL